MGYKGSLSRANGLLIAAALAFATALGSVSTALRKAVIPETQIGYRPIEVAADGYVSSRTCKTCHPSQYETWYGSYHRTMTQVASPQTVRANFDGTEISIQGRPVRLERNGSEFWAEFDDPDATWSEPRDRSRRIKRQILMVTGSHHQQVYWYSTGQSRMLGQLPGTFLISEQKWIPRSAAFLAPPASGESESGRWNAGCIKCHTTNGTPGFDTVSGSAQTKADTTVAEFGISCEACHGPGERHISLNRNPLRRYDLHRTGNPDPSIVSPARLKPHLSSQVCGQCHGITDDHDQQGQRRADMTGPVYRPGHDLSLARFIVQPTRNLDSPGMQKLLTNDPDFIRRSFWSDGMIRVSGREYNGLIDSPCFTFATDEARTLTCFSCHTMHKTPEDTRSTREWARTHQVSSGKQGNEACVQCHAPIGANLSAHTNHAPASSGSSCYNCHMPYTTYGLLKALRSHQISTPTVSANLQTGRPNACNLCHLDKTLAWTSTYLGQWYGIPAASLGRDEQAIAASTLWLLRGDAGQRALVAWSMGWKPAQLASGTSWMGVYLAQLLEDPYDAVRFISHRSLRSVPGFTDFEYNFVAPASQRFADTVRALEQWREFVAGRADRRRDPELLFDSYGAPQLDTMERLLRERDGRPILLRE